MIEEVKTSSIAPPLHLHTLQSYKIFDQSIFNVELKLFCLKFLSFTKESL